MLNLFSYISKLTVSFRTNSANLNVMAAKAIPRKMPPGRPRSERSRSKILKAAAALLISQGPRRMSIEGVADRAGVSKATIYRWWESKGELALDALVVELVATLKKPYDTGSLRGDLLGYMRAVAQTYANPKIGRTQAAIIGEMQSDLVLRKVYRERVSEPLRVGSREIFSRAIQRGEIGSATDIDLLLDVLIGAVFFRLLFDRGPLTESFGDSVVDVVLKGVSPSDQTGKESRPLGLLQDVAAIDNEGLPSDV
jgi:AcrR family transcriptional regulator